MVTRRRRAVGLALVAVLAMAAGSILLASCPATSPVLRAVAVGAAPSAIAVDIRTGRTFVANTDGGTVSVLDTRSGTLLHTVPVGYGPSALTVDEPAGRVFVVSGAGLSVSMLDAGSGRLLRTMPLTGSPMALALDVRAARLLVAKADQTIDLFDARSGRQLHTTALTVSAAQNVAPVAVDERSGHVVLVNASNGGAANGSAALLDATSGRLLRTTIVGPAPTDVVVDAATGRTFVATSSSIAVLDTSSGALLRTVPVGPGSSGAPLIASAPLADERTGHVFVVTNTYTGAHIGRVAVLDAASGRLVRVTSCGVIPQMAVLDALTARLFVFGFDGLSVLDARSGRLLHRWATALGPPPWLGTLASVAVDGRSGRVFVIDAGAASGVAGVTGRVSVLDGHTGATVRSIPVGVAPVALMIDSRARRLLVLDGGGVVPVSDPLGWMPSWLRHLVPFLPRAGARTRTVPASVSVVALDRL